MPDAFGQHAILSIAENSRNLIFTAENMASSTRGEPENVISGKRTEGAAVGFFRKGVL
jgi:hypothetical protein